MAGLFRRIARAANFLGLTALAVTLLASDVSAFAQTGSTPLSGKVLPQANGAPRVSDSKASAQALDPLLNTTEIDHLKVDNLPPQKRHPRGPNSSRARSRIPPPTFACNF